MKLDIRHQSEARRPEGHATASGDAGATEHLVLQRAPEWPYWIVAVVAGGITGYLQVTVKDPTLSAVLLVATNIFIASMRPRRPWRWGVVTALCLPTAELLAYLTREHPTRAMVYGSFVGLAPALAAAFGGAAIRRAVDTLFPKR